MATLRYRTIPCMMQLRTWRIWTWLCRRLSACTPWPQCEHVTVHDTHTGIECKRCSTNFIRLQTFLSLLYVVYMYIITCISTLKTATEQTVIDCFSWMSICSNYPVLSSVLFIFRLKTFISLASPRLMPFKGISCLTSHNYKICSMFMY